MLARAVSAPTRKKWGKLPSSRRFFRHFTKTGASREPRYTSFSFMAWLRGTTLFIALAALAAVAGCETLGSIASDGVDFAGAKADAHCDRRYVTDGGQPAAFCQEVVSTVAAAEFADDCRTKHEATAAPGLCPRTKIIAGCKLLKKNDDQSLVWDWYYDVSDIVAEAGVHAGPDGGPTFDSQQHSVTDVAQSCADPTRYEEGAVLARAMTFAILAAPLFLLAAPPADVAAGATGDADAPSAPAVQVAAAPETAPRPPVTPEARARTALNDVFLETFGSGLLYSLNYERIIDKWNIGVRAGASYFTYAVSSYGKSGNLTLVSFPVLASYYYGLWRGHHLQLGLGATILYTGVATDSLGTKFDDERSGAGLAASAVVGYRYMPRDGGVSFGVAFTPLVRTSKFLPWGGANVGYAF